MNPFETARPPERLEHRLDACIFRIDALLRDLQHGRVMIPPGPQRPAWDQIAARMLMDNLYRGYPVGPLLLWAPADQPETLQVVDGQWRLATLADLLLPSHGSDTPALCFDLDHQIFVSPPTAPDRARDPSRWLPLDLLLDASPLLDWLYTHAPDRARRERAVQLGQRLREQTLLAHVVRGGDAATLLTIQQRMQGGAHDPVTEFLRQDAGLPHGTWLLGRYAQATLDRFFRLHPHPHPRSRDLLARWLWRSAWQPARPTPPNLIDPRDEEGSVQRLLHAVSGGRGPLPATTARFDVRQTPGQWQALALLALQPLDLDTGAPIPLNASMPPVLTPILKGKERPPAGALALSVANRLAHPTRPSLRKALLRVTDPAVLDSHGISPEAFLALQVGDGQRFLSLRAATLQQHFEQVFARHARWDATDRPSLASLVVSDDEEDT